MTSPMRRSGSPIPQSSRLLQHTASTYLKARDAPGIPVQRDSLAFETAVKRGASPVRRTDSPSSVVARTQSPGSQLNHSSRCRNEAYHMHFEGTGVADIFSSGVAKESRPTSPNAQMRRAAPHRGANMFASEAVTRHGEAVESGRRGLWTNQEGSESLAYTGSRRHFAEPQNLAASMPTVQSLDSTSDFACSSNGGEDTLRTSKKMIPLPVNINGSACSVVGATTDDHSHRSKARVDSAPVSRMAPYHEDSTPVRGSESSAPTSAARMPSTTPAAPSILEHRDGGWGSLGQSSARREIAAVEGRGNASKNMVNLGTHSPGELKDRPFSIRPMAGPPAFVPPSLPQRNSPSRRCNSPVRNSSFGVFSVNGSNTPGAPCESSPSAARLGRAVGMYSPLRRGSNIF